MTLKVNSQNPPVLTAEYVLSRAVVSPSGCIEWPKTYCGSGYGVIRRNRKQILVHRLIWKLLRGAIPEGMFVLHKCDNRKCLNVEHLFLGTAGDNARDMCSKGRHFRDQQWSL